jgi:uncharacterized protein (TIGR03790 family)
MPHVCRVALAAGLLVLLGAGALQAGGGPRNVLVVVNEASGESLEIGSHYLRERGIPAANLCRIQTTTDLSTTKAVYQAEIETPIESCIAASPYAGRIDYIVLTRGIPIRANFPGGWASTAALLQVMDTPLQGNDVALGYGNPYERHDPPEWFSHSKTYNGGSYHLYIVTMLSGYWSEDAISLVDKSVASDRNPPTSNGGIFYLEDGNPAADVRNGELVLAADRIQTIWGYPAVHLEVSEAATDTVVASHLNSGSYSQISRAQIDSNEYPPGAIVDVFESYGLVPANFDPSASPSQRPATWWVTAGATGVHGTVAEPYNVAFPDGYMLEPYLDGYNLGETFYQGIPYLYWMNLVLGDPLAQPWADPPVVFVDDPLDGATVSGDVDISAHAWTPRPEGIWQLEFFAGDVLLQTMGAEFGQTVWDTSVLPDGWHRIEVVAYEATPVYAQATEGIDVYVDNHGLALTITDPPAGTEVSGIFPVTVEAVGDVNGVIIECEGIQLGLAPGTSPFVVDVDSARLGRGLHALVAHGMGSLSEVRSPEVDVFVVVAPKFYAPGGVPSIDPPEGPQTGGTLVTILGWHFEDGIRVFFGGRESPAVNRIDANRLEAETPPGPAGPVEVRLENPGGPATAAPDSFNYTFVPCAVTASIAGLRVSEELDGRTSLDWPALDDPCLAGYQVYSLGLADPDPAAPPLFPDDFADVTDLDEDGDVGGDPFFLWTPVSERLILFQAVGEGTDGTIGPR